MKTSSLLLIRTALLLCAFVSLADDQTSSTPATPAPPVAFPELDHYKDLWEKSLFTSHVLPSAPVAGPSFTDNLTLAGIYEINGSTVAVVLDKTTSQVMEVTDKPDKLSGIQIVEVDPGTSPYKARVRLQRGNDSGWVAIPDSAQNVAPVIQNPQLPRFPVTPAPNPASNPPSGVPQNPSITPPSITAPSISVPSITAPSIRPGVMQPAIPVQEAPSPPP